MTRLDTVARRLAAIAAIAASLSGCNASHGSAEPSAAGAGDEATGGALAWEPVDYGAAFSERWYDGSAELASYDLTYPRYGELRAEGTAVAITVAEHLDLESRVKPERDPASGVSAIKLNLVEDFQTGVYDYNLMTSAWVAVPRALGRPPGAPLKVAFSSQEWCGMTFQMVRFGADAVDHTVHSYFEGEADGGARLSRPTDAFAEDALLLWARGLGGPKVVRGETVDLPLLRSTALARLRHVPLAYDPASLSRDADAVEVEVPAGTFQAEVATVRVRAVDGLESTYGGGAPGVVRERTWTFWIEAGGDRRVLRYARSDGLEARLVASSRERYWGENAVADEARLQALGLSKRPPRTP